MNKVKLHTLWLLGMLFLMTAWGMMMITIILL